MNARKKNRRRSVAAVILALAVIAAQKKANVIHILLASGILGIVLGMVGEY